MRPSLRSRLLWRAVGLLLHFAGLAGFLLVAVDAYLAAPARPFSAVSTVHLLAIAASLALSLVGRAVGWKLGHGDRQPGPPGRRDQTPLERLGYHVLSDTPEMAPEGAVVCDECGAHNDDAFTYCRDCSAELPD
ncbi:MAG: hypothetical protein ABEH77_07705 [Halobacteriaceae archaeon]